MTATVSKWRVWCNTDSVWEEGWSDVEPTTCFKDVTHTIDTTKTSIIDQVTSGFPISDIGAKIAVHNSPKPIAPNITTYAVWTGCGDDLTTTPHRLGSGPLLSFEMTPGTALMVKDMQFSPSFGKVWIHEANLKFSGAHSGDFVTAYVVSPPAPLQTIANLSLYIDNNWVKPVPTDGSITPTHGFAAAPALMPRTFSHDGDWDYDGVTLTPNYNGNGGYKISDIERYIHKFVNRIPLCGDNQYLTLTSTESAFMPVGYCLRVEVHNNSNTSWDLDVFIAIYREMTNVP